MAVPRPSFPWRCRTWTRRSALVISSASRPVPSGELSSMTSTSPAGAWAWISAIRGARLSRSLYVAIMTRMRGSATGDDTRAPYFPDHCGLHPLAPGVYLTISSGFQQTRGQTQWGRKAEHHGNDDCHHLSRVQEGNE